MGELARLPLEDALSGRKVRYVVHTYTGGMPDITNVAIIVKNDKPAGNMHAPDALQIQLCHMPGFSELMVQSIGGKVNDTYMEMGLLPALAHEKPQWFIELEKMIGHSLPMTAVSKEHGNHAIRTDGEYGCALLPLLKQMQDESVLGEECYAAAVSLVQWIESHMAELRPKHAGRVDAGRDVIKKLMR